MNCFKCKRNCTASIKVDVRIYREGRMEPVNGCFGEWKVEEIPHCNRHKSDALTQADTLGHLKR